MTQQWLIGFVAALMTSQAAAMAEPTQTTGAPSGTAETRYCMHVGPVTGNLAEKIECWTRDEWTDEGVDVDKEWGKEGVRTIG